MLWAVFLLLVFKIWILPDRFLSVMDIRNVLERNLIPVFKKSIVFL